MKSNGIPRIERITPRAAIPGGEVTIHGSGFELTNHSRPRVHFGTTEASLLLASEDFLIARVPDGADGGALRVATSLGESLPYPISLGVQIADNLHPVANPAVDHDGNIYVTLDRKSVV